MIAKPGNKLEEERPLREPPNKIVLFAMRMVLGIIYEPTFLDSCHGFRPNFCHTALKRIELRWRGISFIEFDIRKWTP